MHRAIIAAWLLACGSAFQPTAQHGPIASHDRRVPRDTHRRYRLPPLFGTDPSTIAYNREYLTRTLGVSDDKIWKVSGKEWNILTLEIGVLEGRVRWLSERLALKENEVKKIAQQHPNILQKQSEDNLAPKLDYLQSRLLLDDASLRKLILTAPQVLGKSIEDNLEPKLDWLQQRLHLDDAAVSKMIKRHPVIFCYDIDTTLEPTLNWLQQRLGLDDAAVSKMIKLLPALFGYNIDTNLEPKLEWLQQRFDLSNSAVSDMIQKCPSILGYNVDTNLGPTLNFYIDALGDEGEALALVTQYPNLLSYSLEKRLKTRLEQAQDTGSMIDANFLQRIAGYTSDKWQRSLTFQANKLK